MKRSEIKKLDKIWSEKIKEIGNYRCLKCGTTNRKLESAHIVGRGAYNTRWRLDNGLCLCFTCHQDYDQHRNHMESWVRDWIGEEKWNELQEAGRPCNAGKKYFYEEIKKELDERDKLHNLERIKI